MNFLFKKILVGLITNIISFVPVFVLIQLFKITSSRQSKLKRLKNFIDKINMFYRHRIKNTGPKTMFQSNKKQLRKRSFLLPWWFKIVLYLISFTLMALSIAFVIFKGKKTCFLIICIINS